MTLPPRFSLLHSDLNDFLFALVGDQQNGMPLNVISALTRLDIDPWAEAARLAALPTPLAVEALAPIVAQLPIDRGLRTNIEISRRLAALLPTQGRASTSSRVRTTANDKICFGVIAGLACLALAAAVLTAIL
jgi:hypothetical protein